MGINMRELYCYWSSKKEREMRVREKQNKEQTPELMCVGVSEADFISKIKVSQVDPVACVSKN